MEISAEDDGLKFNAPTPGLSVALITQDAIDVTTLRALVDYLISRCQAYLTGKHSVRFSVINITGVRAEIFRQSTLLRLFLAHLRPHRQNDITLLIIRF